MSQIPPPNSPQPSGSQQPQAGSTTKQSRARNQRNKNKAMADINPNAKPVDISDMIAAVRQLEKGNVQVTLDEQLVERWGQDETNVFSAVQIARDHHVGGVANNVDYYKRGLLVGASLACARKLVFATPERDIQTREIFNGLTLGDIDIPKSLVQLTDSLGKTRTDETRAWNIRVKYNQLVIQRLLAKAIRYAGGNQDYLLQRIPGNLHNGIQNMVNCNFNELLFPNRHSVQYTHDNVKSRLNDLFSRQLTWNVFDNQGNAVVINGSAPNFNTDNYTRQDILAWLARLDANIHADPNDANYFNNLLACGLALLMNEFWLTDINQQLQNLDAALNLPVIGNFTVAQVVAQSGFDHIQNYLPYDQFKTCYDAAYSYYNEVISTALLHSLDMVRQGRGSFGTVAQLMHIDEDQLVQHPEAVGRVARMDINPGLAQAGSILPIEVIDTVVRGSMYRLVRSVEMVQDFEVLFGRKLVGIRSDVSSRDSVFAAKIRKTGYN